LESGVQALGFRGASSASAAEAALATESRYAALAAGQKATAAAKSYSEVVESGGGLRYTDMMSKNALNNLVKDIRKNGLQNPTINYVEINGRNYVVLGNNRVRR
jgi:hypothetical protein